jgi:signal transduction histidine kinase
MVHWLLWPAALADIALFSLVAQRVVRSRRDGASLRLRSFGALAAATLLGALLTGLYATAEEALRTGVMPIAARIAPKAFLVGSALLWLSAAAAAIVGRWLSRSVEELTEAATRIAEGELSARLPRGQGREARRLARALASMRRELEGRPYAAAFLRDAWHDLKTPAAAVKATVEILEEVAADDPAAQKRFLANLHRASDQLERTLDDLVTLSRFETATLANEERIGVATLVADAIAKLRPLADARSVTLASTLDSPSGSTTPTLRCDPTAILRALSNLLENAIAATPGGRVSIELSPSPEHRLTLDVVNEPSEVPRDMRDRLFERAATSRKGSGSGLGLAIARAAIEAHGGRVRFVELGPPRVRVRIELPT